MAKVQITVDGWRCERCDHEWIPNKGKTPKVCPKCKSAYWDTPRKADQETDKKHGKSK